MYSVEFEFSPSITRIIKCEISNVARVYNCGIKDVLDGVLKVFIRMV